MAFFEGLKMTGGYSNGPDIINSCSVEVNRGEIENKGIEASLNAIILDNNDFTLSIGGNIAFNKDASGAETRISARDPELLGISLPIRHLTPKDA